MRRFPRLAPVMIGCAVAPVGFGTVTIAAAGDDQAVADAAIAALTERVTSAGWVSGGPAVLDDRGAADDDLFAGCEDEAASLNAEFTFAPDGLAATTTDFLELPNTDGRGRCRRHAAGGRIRRR